MRALRVLNELRARYKAARADDIRQTIIITGAMACDDEPPIHLLPGWRIIGGLPQRPPIDDGFADDYMPADVDTVDAIA